MMAKHSQVTTRCGRAVIRLTDSPVQLWLTRQQQQQHMLWNSCMIHDLGYSLHMWLQTSSPVLFWSVCVSSAHIHWLCRFLFWCSFSLVEPSDYSSSFVCVCVFSTGMIRRQWSVSSLLSVCSKMGLVSLMLCVCVSLLLCTAVKARTCTCVSNSELLSDRMVVTPPGSPFSMALGGSSDLLVQTRCLCLQAPRAIISSLLWTRAGQ